jgi:hypothetical protein
LKLLVIAEYKRICAAAAKRLEQAHYAASHLCPHVIKIIIACVYGLEILFGS